MITKFYKRILILKIISNIKCKFFIIKYQILITLNTVYYKNN